MATRVLFLGCLIIAVLVGCTAVPDPAPIPQNLAGEVATVVATRPEAASDSPLAAASSIPPISTEILATETAVTIPTPELMLYDLETGEFLPPISAVPYTPLWSPDSSRFVYQHPTDGLSIFDRRTHTTYPLATSGGERLSNPQWSYDGTYLSVTVDQEDGSRDTAVLQLP